MYRKEDAMELLGLEDGEEDLVVATGAVVNVASSMLHGVKIKEDEVSVQVTKSLNDGYLLYKKVTLDFPKVECCGQVVGGIILWGTEFMRHA
jgi:hypothetical protein